MKDHKQGLGWKFTLKGGRWNGMVVRVDDPLDTTLDMGGCIYVLTPTPGGKHPYECRAKDK